MTLPRSIALHSDQPLVETKAEKNPGASFKTYAQLIASCVRGTEGPFIFGVYGEWGAGKTSLMRLIAQDLDEPKVREEEDEQVVVWFNAWHYHRENNLLSHLLVEVIETLKQRTDLETQPLIKALQALNYVVCRRQKHKDHAVGEENIEWFSAPTFEQNEHQNERSDAHDESSTATTSHDTTTDDASTDDANAREKPEVLSSPEVLLPIAESDIERSYAESSQYYHVMQNLRNAVLQTPGIKIVLMVDDLDRCLPEKALYFIESMKLILNLQNFVFVLGIARTVIEGVFKNVVSKEIRH